MTDREVQAIMAQYYAMVDPVLKWMGGMDQSRELVRELAEDRALWFDMLLTDGDAAWMTQCGILPA
jgi:hypothetical protein